MRDFLNSILEFIGAEDLTDQEYAETQPMESNPGDYSQEVYDAMKAVLVEREAVSDELNRLQYFFQAKGVQVTGPVKPAASNLLIGAKL